MNKKIQKGMSYLDDKIQDIKRQTEYVTDSLAYIDIEHFEWLIEQAERADKLQDRLDAKITFVNNGKEEEQYALQEQNKELKSLCLWSARRLKHQQYKDFAYDQFEKLTGEKWSDYDDTI